MQWKSTGVRVEVVKAAIEGNWYMVPYGFPVLSRAVHWGPHLQQYMTFKDGVKFLVRFGEAPKLAA